MQGIWLGPADLAASREMKTTRVGGGHPGYRVLADASGRRRRRASPAGSLALHVRQDGRCLRAAGIKPFYGPFGDIADPAACEQQFRNAYLMGCVGAWTLHPSPDRDRQARVHARSGGSGASRSASSTPMPDGTGVAMLDGKMQDDATWKQAKVIVDLGASRSRRRTRRWRRLRAYRRWRGSTIMA